MCFCPPDVNFGDGSIPKLSEKISHLCYLEMKVVVKLSRKKLSRRDVKPKLVPLFMFSNS